MDPTVDREVEAPMKNVVPTLALVLALVSQVVAQPTDPFAGGGQRKQDTWFHYSQTRVTPEEPLFVTCLTGAGTEYVLGTRGHGLFRFETTRRLFEPFPGAERFTQEQITCIEIGHGRGELWVGTYFSGLHHRRPDGGWEIFALPEGLPGTQITCLLRDASGLWVGTDGGMARWEGGRFRTFGLNVKIDSVAVDPRSGRVYAGHAGSRLSVWDPARSAWSSVTMAITPPVALKHLLVEPSGDILVGTFLGLFRIDSRTGAVRPMSGDGASKLISCLQMGEDGVVYVGVFGKDKGIHALRGDTLENLFRGYAGFTETSAMRRTRAGDWLIVSFGRLWHFTDRFLQDGTLSPVDYRGPGSMTTVAVPRAEAALPLSDASLATLPPPPAGLPVSPSPVLPAPIAPPSPSPVVASTAVAGFESLLPGENVLSLVESVSRIWVGTAAGGLHVVDGDGSVRLAQRFQGPVSVLHFGAGGRLTIVVAGTAIHQFNGFVYRRVAAAPATVTALADGPAGSLMVGTTAGLYRLEGDRLVAVVPGAGALPDPGVTSLLASGGDLWVGTRLGLARITNGTVKVFTAGDGLPSADVTCLALHGGRIWTGGSGGVAALDGERFRGVGTFAPVGFASAGGDLWVARPTSLSLWREGSWRVPMGTPGGAVGSVLAIARGVAVGTDRGLMFLPTTIR